VKILKEKAVSDELAKSLKRAIDEFAGSYKA
jgi:hypothetical protein